MRLLRNEHPRRAIYFQRTQPSTKRHNAMIPTPFILHTSSFILHRQPIIATPSRSRAVTIPPKKPRFPRENGGTPAREREKPSFSCNVAGVTNPRTAKNAGKRAFFAIPFSRVGTVNEKNRADNCLKNSEMLNSDKLEILTKKKAQNHAKTITSFAMACCCWQPVP